MFNFKKKQLILLVSIFSIQNLFAIQYLGYPDSPLPDEVIIKTQSTGLNTNFEYAISGGKLYYKTRKDRLGNPITAWTKSGKLDQFHTPHPNAIEVPSDLDWHLFKGTGLPEIKGQVLSDTDLQYLWADADEVGVVNQDYSTFWLRERTDKKQWPMGEWNYLFGTPTVRQLTIPKHLQNYRGFSLGRRTEEVKWFEDGQGVQHHWGTFNISTLYLLDPTGRSIYYLDPGIPADYRYQVCLPFRSRIELIALDASSATMMVMDKKGNVYTRLEDFDTNGADSMLFDYSYKKNDKEQLPGVDPASRWTTYFLDEGDNWQMHKMRVQGQGKVSRFISIITTGRGNSARELRVAGLGENGEPGYYTKKISDKDWHFVKAELLINPSDLFVPGKLTKSDFSAPIDLTFKGNVKFEGKTIEVEVRNFNNACVDSIITLSLGKSRKVFKFLHDQVHTRAELPTFDVPELPVASLVTLLESKKMNLSSLRLARNSRDDDEKVLRRMIKKYFGRDINESFSFKMARFQNHMTFQSIKNKWEIKLKETNADGKYQEWTENQLGKIKETKKETAKYVLVSSGIKLLLTPASFNSKLNLMRKMIPLNMSWIDETYKWAIDIIENGID